LLQPPESELYQHIFAQILPVLRGPMMQEEDNMHSQRPYHNRPMSDDEFSGSQGNEELFLLPRLGLERILACVIPKH
jgi:hypothetical protein